MRLRDILLKIAEKIIGRAGYHAYLYSESDVETGRANPDPGGTFERAYANVELVFSCVRAIGQFTAMVPYVPYLIPPGKSIEEKERLPYDHGAPTLLREVNPVYTQYQLKEAVAAYLELTGNAFILKEDENTLADPPRDYAGPPTELWVLRTSNVSIVPNTDGTIKGYYYKAGGKKLFIDQKQMIHLKYFNPYDPLYGQSTLEALQRTITIEHYGEVYAQNFLKNNARPYGALVFKGYPSEPQRKTVREEWKKMHGGPEKAGRFALFWGDFTWEEIGKTPHEIGFPKLEELTHQRIMRGFGVYPAVLGELRANYATQHAERKMFAENTMIPKLTLINQGFEQFLWSDFEENIVAAWDYSNVPALKDDEKAKSEIVDRLVRGRIFCPNELRQKFYDEEPYEGGSIFYIPQNVVPGGEVKEARKRASAGAEPKEHTLKQIKRWDSYVHRISPVETDARKRFEDMFERQRKHTLKKLSKTELPRAGERDITRDLSDDIFEYEFFAQSTKATMDHVVKEAVKAGITHGKEPLEGITIDFSMKNPELVEYMEQHAAMRVRDLTKTTKTLLDKKTRTALQEALAEQMSPQQTMRQVERAVNEVFDFRRGNAKTIARTEVTQGVQDTQLKLWKSTAVVEMKEWLSSMSPNMRLNHGDINGERVGIDERFPVVDVRYPGDPTGAAAETINCLCDMSPVVSLEKKAQLQVDEVERMFRPASAGGEGTRRWMKQEKIKALGSS